MDKFVIGYIWFLSIVFAFFWGSELRLMQVDSEMRSVYQARITDNNKLQSCQKIIAKIK